MSELLLDTHTWIWAEEGHPELGPYCRESLLNESNNLYISPISTLELARLIELGRIRLKSSLAAWIQRSCKNLQLSTAEFSHAIAIESYSLPGLFHRDPADRILVATARSLGMQLVTADQKILDYKAVQTLNARN